jgi:hypothetical protein
MMSKNRGNWNMSHLSAERLAALIDEQPSSAELSHLAVCADCTRERAAFHALSGLASAGPAIATPLTNWESLSPALGRAGLLRSPRAQHFRNVTRGWTRVAAAILLVAAGVVTGRVTAGAPLVGRDLAANSSGEQATTDFGTVAEAEQAALHSQNVYRASLAFIASHDPSVMSPTTPAAVKTRLAALNQVDQIASAALEDSPFDSVINTIYLAVQGQREVSMRQLNAATMHLTSY